MSPSNLPQLPPNVKHLLSAYIGESQLKELPACFTYRPVSILRTRLRGHPITYKHRDTGETVQVDTYLWKTADKYQSVVVASGKCLTEPVIIVPAHKRSSVLKTWREESINNDEDEDSQCPIYKVFADRRYTHNKATIFADEDEKSELAAKRQKTHHKTNSPNHIPTDSISRPVVEADTSPYIVAAESSEDEVLTLRGLRKRNDRFAPSEDFELVSGTSSTAAVRRETTAVSVSGPTENTPINLTDSTDVRNVRVKSEPEDSHSTANASSLLTRFSTAANSSGPSVSKVASSIHVPAIPMTPTSISSLTPTPEQLPPTQSSPSERAAPGIVSDATTFVFLDGKGRELRRRTFEEMRRQLDVGTLFGQAVRAGLIGKSDSDAILSVTIRGFGKTFAILRDDKPDFARLMQSIEVVGLCMVEVRLD